MVTTESTALRVFTGDRLWAADCSDTLAWLRGLPADSVHCVVTSPPYYGLRSYLKAGHPDKPLEIGGEQTPAEYVGRMVAVFREVRRVLHPSGSLWLNLGDSYSSHGSRAAGKELDYMGEKANDRKARRVPGYKPKDLLGIPWLVAFALRADGWYLRQHCPWVKRNPMPESVTDRPGTSCEEVFLLSKRADYFYDPEPTKRPASGTDDRPQLQRARELAAKAGLTEAHIEAIRAAGATDTGKATTTQTGTGKNTVEVRRLAAEAKDALGGYYREFLLADTRNRRNSDWWFDSVGMMLSEEGDLLGLDVTTKPYKGAHFAVMPKALVEPCVLASTSAKGVCPGCGEPWVRVVKRERVAPRGGVGAKAKVLDIGDRGGLAVGNRDPERHVTSTETVGWEPGCTCGSPAGMRPDDTELIDTPTGERAGPDPTMETGRRGMNRPRGEAEGSRPITRYEQRQYADQLRGSPHRAEMEAEAGPAFAHYTRTDRSGARPVPPALLATWVGRGWLVPVELPSWEPPEPVPAVVLDPFAGSGTVLQVAVDLGRRAVGCELNPDTMPLIHKRMDFVTPSMF